MFNEKNVIQKINKTCAPLFSESSFVLNPVDHIRYVTTGNNCSKAINCHKEEREQVNVIKMFNSYWFYADIKFIKADKQKNSIPKVFISTSVFQGEGSDSEKRQLFRAEWDNHDDNDNHPQPHWHVLTKHDSLTEFSEFVDVDDGNGFTSIINQKSKNINLNKMHFAMNGHWDTNGDHINKITTEDEIVGWINGLLKHIISQLKYIDP